MRVTLVFRKATFIILFILPLTLSAQELQSPVNIQSPNAASLGKYGHLPVSYYTGTASVSVPVTDLNINGMPLNVSLTYDASGIRVDEHPGWVGQNWSLEAGGVITRTADGFPDEFGATDEKRISYTEQAYYHLIDQFDVRDSEELKALAEARLTSDWTTIEYEPDIFSFNFMGISGKFFLANDGQWKVNSEHNLEIIHDVTLPENYTRPFIELFPGMEPPRAFDYVIYGFKIRDDQGNIYTFGYDQNAIEYSIPFWNQVWYSPYQVNVDDPTHWTANSWYLTKVQDKYLNTVYEFKYERGYYIASLFKFNTSLEKRAKMLGWPFLVSYNWIANGSLKSSTIDLSGSLISPVYLSEITTQHQYHIKFHKSISTELEYSEADIAAPYKKIQDEHDRRSAGDLLPLHFLQSDNQYSYGWPAAVNNPLKGLRWFKLDKIEVFSAGSVVKRVHFEYNNHNQQRLNLLGLTFSGESTTNKYSYHFNYNQFELLPEYLSQRTDHWGYFRGSRSVLYPGDFTKPVDFNHFEQYFYTRTSQPEYLQTGMLTSVEYPTGGRTQFVYEPHEYSRIVNDARNGFLQETGITGGLRIKSITDFDGTNSLTRNFKYVKDYKDGGSTSSGILGLKPKYYFKDWRTTTSYDQPYIESIFSTNTIIPLANYFGTHIGYSEVTEERADGSFTTFKFTSHEDYMDESPYGTLSIQLSPYQRFNDRGFLRGKLKEKAEFDYTRQIKRKTVYRFNDGFDQKYGLATNAMWGYASAPTNGQKYYRGQAWKIYYMDFDVKEEEITLYQAGQSVTELTRFIKEDIHRPSNHVRLTKQIIKDISGDQFKTVFRYPIDLVAHDNMQPLIDANRLGEIVWTENFKNNDWIGVKKISYRTENSLFVPAIIRTSSTDHENLREELVFDKYDNKGNVLQFHGVDGLVTSVVWCYGTTRPSIIIKGATYDEVLAAFAALSISISDVNYTWHWSETDFRARVAALRTQLPNAHILHYTYNSFGISSESDANGTTTFHEYDDLGRLKLTKDFDGNILKKNTYQFK